MVIEGQLIQVRSEFGLPRSAGSNQNSMGACSTTSSLHLKEEDSKNLKLSTPQKEGPKKKNLSPRPIK